MTAEKKRVIETHRTNYAGVSIRLIFDLVLRANNLCGCYMRNVSRYCADMLSSECFVQAYIYSHQQFYSLFVSISQKVSMDFITGEQRDCRFCNTNRGSGVATLHPPLTSPTDQLETRFRCLPSPFSGTCFSMVSFQKQIRHLLLPETQDGGR